MSTPEIHPFIAPLHELAVLCFQGADAVQFLHAQLSNDIADLAVGQASPGGYFTAQGRLLATLVVWRAPDQPDTLYAMVSADLAEALVKKLSMFVFRSKVKISVTSLPVAGLYLPGHQNASDISASLQQLLGLAATSDTASSALTLPTQKSWQTAVFEQLFCIQAPVGKAGGHRWWIIGTDAGWPRSLPLDAGAEPEWHAQDIAAGLVRITAQTQELFLAQAVNLDLSGAINFEKGCYPGQEIIARSHYRGTTKRRTAYGIAQASPDTDVVMLPGADVFDATRPGVACGRVVSSSQSRGQLHVLFETQLSSLDHADFRLLSEDGPQLVLQPLSYTVKVAE